MKSRRPLLAALMVVFSTGASATDLLQVWEAARQHDPQGTVVEAARAAGAARRDMGSALWRPEVGLSASVGRASSDTRMNGAHFVAPGFAPNGMNGVSFGTSVENGNASRWSLGIRQALYNAERSAQRRQLGLAADAADLEWQAARQDWMLLTAQRYFDLLLAERRLSLLKSQRQAVQKAWSEAKDRFEIGDAPITGKHEAAARERALEAQVLLAANDHEVALDTLAALTGLATEKLRPRPPGDKLNLAPTGSLDQALQRAAADNPWLRLMQAQVDVAQAETDKHRLEGAPTVDLVAQASRERISGSGDYGVADNTESRKMVGLAVNIPLYTGGWRSAKLEESLRLADKSRAELERSRIQVREMTRSAWLAVRSGEARLEALAQALVASRARLDATRLGRQVGDRSTLDLLNAENDATSAELALMQARADLLMSRLRLDAAMGKLDMESLQQVNACLDK